MARATEDGGSCPWPKTFLSTWPRPASVSERSSFAHPPGQREVSAGSARGKCGGNPGLVRSFLEPCLLFPPPKPGLEVLPF